MAEATHFNTEQVEDFLWGIDAFPADTFGAEPCGEAEGGEELDGFRGADASDASEFFGRTTAQAREGSVVLKEAATDAQGGFAAGAGVKKQGEEFAFCEGGGTECKEAALGVIGGSGWFGRM